MLARPLARAAMSCHIRRIHNIRQSCAVKILPALGEFEKKK